MVQQELSSIRSQNLKLEEAHNNNQALIKQVKQESQQQLKAMAGAHLQER